MLSGTFSKTYLPLQFSGINHLTKLSYMLLMDRRGLK
jgi:hypothetical protein